ncbi:MAG: glycosyltransferase [Planctomycetaceae bacterium]|nr:glycosyltransferase [Planctomycetaceae bacterium]
MPNHIAHIGFVAGNYPSPSQPYAATFFEQLIHKQANHGLRCSVVVPWSIQRWVQDSIAIRRGCDFVAKQHDMVTVLRPLCLSFASPRFGLLQCPRISQALYQMAALRAFQRLDSMPDAFYGHFLYPAGGTAVWLGRQLRRPSFVAMGEGSFWSIKNLGPERAKANFAQATGMIAVSSLLKKMLISELAISPDKIAVFPNGVDRGLFFPRPRAEMRTKWNLPQDAFLVAFVGGFDYDKGASRVAEAIEGLDGVFGIFAGAGPLPPRGTNVAFAGRIPHDKLPEFLSTADVFALPTTYEGSCNAIIEAMTCGLPIITSVGEFNDDLVDDTMAIRIDPLDVNAIRAAVVAVRDDSARRRRLAEAALVRSRHFDLDVRATKIEDWMNQCCRK